MPETCVLLGCVTALVMDIELRGSPTLAESNSEHAVASPFETASMPTTAASASADITACQKTVTLAHQSSTLSETETLSKYLTVIVLTLN